MIYSLNKVENVDIVLPSYNFYCQLVVNIVNQYIKNE